MKPLKAKINNDGNVTREEDGKLLATIDIESGKITYSAPVYAKGKYKEAIEGLAVSFLTATSEEPVFEPDTVEAEPVSIPVASDAPPRHPTLGLFSPDHINWDHANLSDEAFIAKYRHSFESKLEFIAKKPHLFHDIPALEERLAALVNH